MILKILKFSHFSKHCFLLFFLGKFAKILDLWKMRDGFLLGNGKDLDFSEAWKIGETRKFGNGDFFGRTGNCFVGWVACDGTR